MKGDLQRTPTRPDVFPPVAGVIYLSVPFWYDRRRPIRQKILQRYYGSDSEDIWGVSEPIPQNENISNRKYLL